MRPGHLPSCGCTTNAPTLRGALDRSVALAAGTARPETRQSHLGASSRTADGGQLWAGTRPGCPHEHPPGDTGSTPSSGYRGSLCDPASEVPGTRATAVQTRGQGTETPALNGGSVSHCGCLGKTQPASRRGPPVQQATSARVRLCRQDPRASQLLTKAASPQSRGLWVTRASASGETGSLKPSGVCLPRTAPGVGSTCFVGRRGHCTPVQKDLQEPAPPSWAAAPRGKVRGTGQYSRPPRTPAQPRGGAQQPSGSIRRRNVCLLPPQTPFGSHHNTATLPPRSPSLLGGQSFAFLCARAPTPPPLADAACAPGERHRLAARRSPCPTPRDFRRHGSHRSPGRAGDEARPSMPPAASGP